MCFMSFLTSRGGIWRFSRALSNCLCTTLCFISMMIIRGLTFHPVVFNVYMMGVIFVCFSSYGNIEESIMAIGEFYELYGV